MRAVRERTAEVLAARGTGDGVICEMVLRHELQHCETMRQTMAIAGLLPAGRAAAPGAPAEPAGWIAIPAGSFPMGAGEEGFAYDNERPRHRSCCPPSHRPAPGQQRQLDALQRGRRLRTPRVVVGRGLGLEGGVRHHPHPAVAAGRADAPVCHVSWFEAEAFARAHGARLPTEAEWERAATSTQQTGAGARGRRPRVGVDGLHLRPYPGFARYPYREYSEVFFGRDYRVLRGGSWATHPRVATLTFRNWDLPQRRQIFAGVRLAREG